MFKMLIGKIRLNTKNPLKDFFLINQYFRHNLVLNAILCSQIALRMVAISQTEGKV